MSKQQKEDLGINKQIHSKAFKEGIGILAGEIELALQWDRPSILLAIHNSKTGRINAQRTLEQEFTKKSNKVVQINVESNTPDVIRVICEMPNPGNSVFFVNGIENADRISDGKVYRALNIRRELLVEKNICVVFWLNESEAANLPRFAPDFWAFRHRVVEFAPQRGTKKQSIPAGLFLWKDHISWMQESEQKNELAHYEELLSHLPKEESSITVRVETTLKTAHYSWLLNDMKKFTEQLGNGFEFLEKHPHPQSLAWMHNAKAIGLHDQGNKEDAGIHFAQALSLDPENSAIMMNSAIAMHGMGKNRNAILAGKRAVKKDPGNSYLWCVLGYLYLSMGKTENAIDAMIKARDKDIDNAHIHYALAVCYYKNNQPIECEKELVKAKEISSPQNALQEICAGILSDKADESYRELKHFLEKGEIGKHHILRDPNLHFLLNPHEFVISDQ